MNLVVDASCFASLFLDDEDSSAAERYLAQSTVIAAPRLAMTETAAAFFRRVRKGTATLEEANTAANEWMSLTGSGAIRFYDDSDVLAAACVAAGKLNHPLQDCVYLELARSLQSTLLTGDHVFARKALADYRSVLVL